MKSTDKLKNYLENYTREKYFTDRVFKIRKDIGIPKNGIKFPRAIFFEDWEKFIGMFLSIKYKNINYPTFPAKRAPIYNELIEPLPSIYKEPVIICFINIYILYNERCYEVFENIYNNIRNTVSLIEYRIAYLEHRGCCECEVKVCEDYMDFQSKKYPIMIGVSPYATQNEVLDIIKKRWDYIQFHMEKLAKDRDIDIFEKERRHLLKIRKRSTISKKIEDLTYENKGLSLKNIRDVVKEKTGKILGYEEIGKIKSLAKKRREKNRK